ncbi:SOS response-associated peptidase family protein [Desertivirga brevis]|uniref:SOS response-associated peptidase family protein n=1 Tax=Desertivirga brevis TaxID=2810310 RepID=UPI001A95C7ED|nr:SOS response-associated peptidase family protein [Pedobacter sp. SYSU D00873]
MQNFKDVLNIPSSGDILEVLNLSFEAEAEKANPHATFGFSVPLVTDECPGRLSYYPLSRNSFLALQENLDETAFIEKMSNKRFCVIICNSYDRIEEEAGQIFSYNPYDGAISFIAGVWDVTEDPLMAASLYSCTFLTVEHQGSQFGRVPYFLRRDQIASWIGNDLDIEQRLALLNGIS